MQELPRGWVGVFACALGLIVWSCSSDSRDFDDGSQSGGAGEGGEPPIAGAGGTDAKIDGGVGGETTGGTVAEAGGGSQSQELSIVSTNPEDAATGTQRNAVVEVTFSAPIDEASITAESFQVTGPSGPVDGELSVDGATVTLTPSKPLSLLADYKIEISTAVGGRMTSLAKPQTFTFQTRDGVFSKPERLSTSGNGFSTSGTHSGYVSVAWQTNATPSSVEAAIYDPLTGKWGPASALETDDTTAYSNVQVALNERGEAFASFGAAGAGRVWNRYNGVNWGAAKSEPTRDAGGWAALTNDGTAMTVWVALVGNESRVLASSLSRQNAWSATSTLQAKALPRGMSRYGTGFIAIVEREGAGTYSHVFDPLAGWGTPAPITDGSVNFFSLGTFEKTAMYTWNDASGRIQASVFDGAEWTTTDLGPGGGGTNTGLGLTRCLATWLDQGSAWGALYDLEMGWGGATKLGATTADIIGPAAAVDASGNAFAAWPNGTHVAWRRQPSGSNEWLDLQEIKDQDPYYVYSNVDAAGNVMLLWNNKLGVWATRFE